jgi:hypothetical protein
VKLQSIIMPDMEFGNTEKGDALYAMELALSLEKLNNEKLLALHKVAEECDDPQMTDYVEGTFLGEQVRDRAHPPLGRGPLHSACSCCDQIEPIQWAASVSRGFALRHACCSVP